MKINRKIYSKVALFLLGVSPIVWNANPARAITGSLDLDNTGFTVDAVSDNSVPGASAIDNTDFGNVFDDGDTFLLLGATGSDASIADSTDGTNANASFSPFEITADNISDGSLNFSFDWAFNGNGEAFDEFSVSVIGTSDFALLVEQTSYGSGTFFQNLDISSFTPGNYGLFVSLSESNLPVSISGNSAAGFDNFMVTEAGVPFEFSPALGLFFVGGLFGGSSYLKRQKAAKIDLK